jgi:antitoxin YefM
LSFEPFKSREPESLVTLSVHVNTRCSGGSRSVLLRPHREPHLNAADVVATKLGLMVRILTTMAEILPFTDAKAHLSDLVDRVVREHERFVVTRNGRPAAVLINPDDLESLEETVEILQDKQLLESIRRSRREAAEGKRVRLKDHI